MKWSEYFSLAAVFISFLALVVPIMRSQQKAKILEILSVPTFSWSTWIYVVVSNQSTAPLSIHGGSLDRIRVYRHKHYFADRPGEGKQYSSEFPVKIPPQSSAGILMEFVDRTKHPLDRSSEIGLVLNADRHPLKKTFVINQTAVIAETALQEI
ncbi:hypothetical protein [Lacticaseibacillus paracasei]|uniref:hypothetical protein n=1 Tax=Lacticaseibacillus paracasei TaxID=1597 RepID=UPI0034E895C1